MSKPRNTEPQANGALARALRRRNPDWNDSTVHAERTHVIEHAVPGTGASKRPDILIVAPRRQPVIVETEFAPARTVEKDATDRLGTSLHGSGENIEGVLSVVLPESLKTGDLETIDRAAFRYATHYLNSKGMITRWPPEREWLKGGVDDLADAIEYLSISELQLERGTEALETVVRHAAGLLARHAGEYALARIAKNLCQKEGEQTERMAAAICVSAFVFHAAIEGQDYIPPVPTAGSIDKGSLLDTWNRILEINYWPIFGIARDLVEELPLRVVPTVMNRIAKSISELSRLGATTYHDLTGRMFQTLITDRKFLATFYTLPESACLLAELAVERLDVDWSDRAVIERLRIADFACGTGALLSAAQRAVHRRYRRAGGNDKDLHQSLMESVLTGLDIMPAATHLTCSMLSSAHPSLAFGLSQIHTMPYGIDSGTPHIGALDLLDSDHSFSLFATARSMEGTKSEGRNEHTVTIKDDSCDLVIMNPPFTRPTNHTGSARDNTPIPSFAGFGKSHDEQRAMSKKLGKCRPEFGHGNAGLASNFMDLGHRKLKDGGVLALVIPFAFARGKAWAKARQTLATYYSDIHVLSIATTGLKESAFSADTNMAECLVIANKHVQPKPSAVFSNLAARPASLLEAAVAARDARGKAAQGDILDAGGAGVLSASVIASAQGIQAGSLSLPRQPVATPIPIARLGAVTRRGLYSLDINGAPPRGAFDIRSVRPNEVPEYPALWNHDAKRERRLVVHPDSCGDVHAGYASKAARDWQRTASRLHFNIDFRLSSQSLAMCLTPEKCLGGSAWPNIVPDDESYESPLLLWCNSTLGLLLHWWNGTRQQPGRSRIKITATPDLPAIDPRVLTLGQRDRCHSILEDFKDRTFLPANEAYRDETRKALDRELLFGVTSVLGIDPSVEEGLDLLRKQWCAEPSVHGGKGTRIEPSRGRVLAQDDG